MNDRRISPNVRQIEKLLTREGATRIVLWRAQSGFNAREICLAVAEAAEFGALSTLAGKWVDEDATSFGHDLLICALGFKDVETPARRLTQRDPQGRLPTGTQEDQYARRGLRR